MSDVQLALLVMGLVIIFLMIAHNWIQIYKNKKRREKFNQNSNNPKINEDNDPLFNSSEFPVNDTNGKKDLLGLEGSKKIIASNLPEGIYQDIEAVASITSSQIYEGQDLLNLKVLRSMKGARLYVRKDDDIWSTDDAIDTSIRFNQILFVQLLASRGGALSDQEVTNLRNYVSDLKDKTNGILFWIANEQIKEQSEKINELRIEVDRSLSLKVIPKSDSSFHSGALIDFFNNNKIRTNKIGIHELYYGEKSTKSCLLLNLSGKALEVNKESFIQGINFKMDIPNTENITQSYNEMMQLIQECCNKLNGVLVDASSKTMSDDYISKVYVSLKNIERKMLDKKIVPGSELARKIFS